MLQSLADPQREGPGFNPTTWRGPSCVGTVGSPHAPEETVRHWDISVWTKMVDWPTLPSKAMLLARRKAVVLARLFGLKTVSPLQPLQSWSSGSGQRASHWSSPVPLSRSTAPWSASTCSTAAPRARPPCCPWPRAAGWGSTRDTGGVCSSAEVCTPCRSTWPWTFYSAVTPDSTRGSWATEWRTALTGSSSVLQRFSCWLKGQVCGSDPSPYTVLKLNPSTSMQIEMCVCVFVVQGGHASALPVTLLCCWPSLQSWCFFYSHSAGWPLRNV